MFAIVRAGGKQVRVAEGERVRVEKLQGDVGDPISLTDVLLISRDGVVRVGAPVVPSVTVQAHIVGHGKAKKVFGFKYKRRKGYRRHKNHRQPFTALEIDAIAVGEA
ncbi:MAG: 50S ribosomal protein L21 [Candidatus Schekmanbacteria bacterium]|nr:50S ribosomal protein L21 [Candidatus Schekmanbacteria bacterium]